MTLANLAQPEAEAECLRALRAFAQLDTTAGRARTHALAQFDHLHAVVSALPRTIARAAVYEAIAGGLFASCLERRLTSEWCRDRDAAVADVRQSVTTLGKVFNRGLPVVDAIPLLADLQGILDRIGRAPCMRVSGLTAGIVAGSTRGGARRADGRRAADEGLRDVGVTARSRRELLEVAYTKPV